MTRFNFNFKNIQIKSNSRFIEWCGDWCNPKNKSVVFLSPKSIFLDKKKEDGKNDGMKIIQRENFFE